MRASRTGLLLAALAGALASRAAAQDVFRSEVLLHDLACGVCHGGIDVETDLREQAPDLSQAGLRYNPDYLFGFLQHPVQVRRHIGAARMPDFRLDEREALALTLYLARQVPAGAAVPDFVLQAAYERARAAHPDITADDGERIFSGLNCRACHEQASAEAWEVESAPDLGVQGARASETWLRAFLRAPADVRPFGFYPGTGGRHPDFRLAPAEVDTLTRYLMTLRGVFDSIADPYEPATLTPFSMAKAEELLHNRLPCLGCHRLGDRGGRIGPDLSSLKDRLTPQFVYEIVRDPQRVAPGTIMPKVEMPPVWLELVVNYLVQQDVPPVPQPPISLADRPLLRPPTSDDDGAALYGRYCASCHGVEGDGDGYNAAFLPVAPTAHADATHMSTRPDDVLFDGVHAGGYILNKSADMPSWGATLTRAEIRSLVAYMRELCDCVGPSWSRR